MALVPPRLLPVIAFVALAACTGVDQDPLDDRTPTSGSVPSGAPVEGSSADDPDDDDEITSAQWTVGIVDERREVTGSALLTEVRIAGNEGFDRFVLEFEHDEIPSYRIEYIDRPVRQCGSGHTVEIAGDAWLSIRLEPADAHTVDGQSTLEDRSLDPELTVVRELRITCDFEAQVEWVLGVSTPNRFRVMELADPARLVIDVRH